MKKNMVEAAKWYRKAAEQGNADAQNRLGVRYDRGEGVSKDAKKLPNGMQSQRHKAIPRRNAI